MHINIFSVSQCFINSEDKEPSRLTDAVWGIVIGHYSSDGKLRDDHFNLKEANHNALACDEMEAMTKIIEWFSFEGQTVVQVGCSIHGNHKHLYTCRNVHLILYSVICEIPYEFLFLKKGILRKMNLLILPYAIE